MLAEAKYSMARSITIRHADSPADLDAIRTLFRQYAAYLNGIFGAEHISLPHYEQEVESLPGRYAAPDGRMLLARVEGVPAACVALYPLPAHEHLPPDTNACELKRLFVLPEFRGMQLGRRLSDELIAFAGTRGYDAMYLDSAPDVLPHASVLYAALGFRSVPRYNDNATTGVKHFRLALYA